MFFLRNRGIVGSGFSYDPILGSGLQGSVTTSSQINTFTYLTSNVNLGSKTISVQSASGLNVRDEILLHQTQYQPNVSIAGNYEFVYIAKISGTTITLNKPLTKTFYSGTPNSANAIITQVVRVPNYTDLVINGAMSTKAWDGFSGGIIVAKCTGTITINSTGSINLTDIGYRLGSRGDVFAFGRQGESWNGLGVNGQSSNGGGGGSNNTGASGLRWPSGGGGGAHAGGGESGGLGSSGPNSDGGCGGSSRTAGTGGSSYGVSDLSRLYLGSASGGNGQTCGGHGSAQGRNGAGSLIFFANSISIASGRTLNLSGIGGISSRAHSGGSAGGAALFKAKTSFINSGSILYSGGGGIGGGNDGASGSGGIGYAAVYSPSRTIGTFSNTPFQSSNL
jgi:hypothetical protein